MSVLMQFTIFPTDKGESVSQYVARVLREVEAAGHPYRLGSMATVVETETMEQATALLNRAYAVLAPDCRRVYLVASFDIREGPPGRLESKVNTVREKAGL